MQQFCLPCDTENIREITEQLNNIEIYNQFNSDGLCSECLKNNISRDKCNLLKHKFPDIYDEIDISKTMLLFKLTEEDIENITYGSNKKIWFKCSKFNCEKKCPHSYDARLSNRTTKTKSGCTICRKYAVKVCKCNSFMRNPLLAKQFDIVKNKDIDPYTIAISSHIELWWIDVDHKGIDDCEGHSWLATVNNRSNGTGCPFCIIGTTSTCLCTSIFITHPRLCKSILKENNPDIDIKKISYGSNQIIIFECPDCKKVFSAALERRTSNGASDVCTDCTSIRNLSNFERRCNEILTNLNIIPALQTSFAYIPTRKFDFYFYYNNVNYIIETDGGIHFKEDSFHHPTHEDFLKQQNVDIVKTLIPLIYNYVILRMSDDNYEHIEKYIKYTLGTQITNPTFFLDDLNTYNYIIKHIGNESTVNELFDTFVDPQYKEEAKTKFKRLTFEVIDIKNNQRYIRRGNI